MAYNVAMYDCSGGDSTSVSKDTVSIQTMCHFNFITIATRWIRKWYGGIPRKGHIHD